VGVKIDGSTGECPAPIYDEYTQTGDNEFKLCLMLNLDKGECINGIDEPGKVVKADCASAEASVIEAADSQDESLCTEGSIPVIYPEPAPGRTLCLQLAETA
jgi:hypothetical protein